MAFMLAYCEGGIIPAIEYLPCSAITPTAGMALTQTGGELALATGTTAPTYISMIEKEKACTAGDIIPVLRVLPGIVFDTIFSAAATSIKLGDKVTLNSSATGVTATTESGVAEIVEMDGTTSGSHCRVRF